LAKGCLSAPTAYTVVLGYQLLTAAVMLVYTADINVIFSSCENPLWSPALAVQTAKVCISNLCRSFVDCYSSARGCTSSTLRCGAHRLSFLLFLFQGQRWRSSANGVGHGGPGGVWRHHEGLLQR